MPTSPVVTIVSGPSFSVNVTAANLDSSLTLRDFQVLENGTLTLNALSYTKTTPTNITYSGPSLAVSTSLEIRRNTPRTQRTVVLPSTKVRASDWNLEFDRRVRIQEEIDVYGAGGGFSVRLPNDSAYGVSWASDALFSPTRRVLYNQIETLASKVSPTFTGLPVAPTATLGDNSTQIATTAFVTSVSTLLAPIASPVFTGNPTAPTQLSSDNSTRIANTAHVKSLLANSPNITGASLAGVTTVGGTSLGVSVPSTFTGVTSVPTVGLGNVSLQAANTTQVARSCRPIVIVSRTLAFNFTSTVTDLVFNNTIRDNSSSYNTTTGLFTAPQAGVYRFSMHVANFSGNSSFTYCGVSATSGVEGVRVGLVAGTGIFQVVNGSIITHMNAGDVRRFYVAISGATVAGSPEATATSQTSCYASVEYLGIDT